MAKSTLISFLCLLIKKCFILNKKWTAYYQDPLPITIRVVVLPTKEEALLCSTCLELILGCSRSFLVFLVRPNLLWLNTNYSRLLHLLQTTIYKMFWLANLQKINFMLDIVTKWGKRYYKMRSFLFYKTGQAVLQKRVGATEWHNFYYKMRGGVFQSGAIITKKRKIVQRDSDNSSLEPHSLKVKLL